jgi:arylsulfatase A-like enzyme
MRGRLRGALAGALLAVVVSAAPVPASPSRVAASAERSTAAALPAPVTSASQPPDIIWIITDDQRFDSMGACFPGGYPGRPASVTPCPMPNVAADLIQHGVTFTLGYVPTSLCCPSRASLFTGNHAHTTGVLTNSREAGAWDAFRPLEGSTVATWLDAAGYRTALVGKYLNKYANTSFVPPGWDEWYVRWAAKENFGYNAMTVVDDGTIVDVPNQDYGSTYTTTMFRNRAVSVVEDTPAGTPLFMMFAPDAPHAPSTPAPHDALAYNGMPKWRPPSFNEADVSDKPAWVRALPFNDGRDELHEDVAETLLEIDRGVADIVDAMDEAGRLDDAMIVFTSDNGLSWGEHGFHDDKFCEYEECHRVPFVIRYDRVTGGVPRVDTTHLVRNLDLPATALELAGVTSPPAIEGRSLLSLVEDPSAPWQTAILGEDFGDETKTDAADIPNLTLVRTSPGDPLGQWQYVELATGERELYDLAADPFQLVNLAGSPAQGSTQAALASRLASLRASTAPVVAFTSGPGAATSSTSASIGFQATGATRFRCSFDSAPLAVCTSPFSVSGLAQGSHALRVLADGPAGTSAAGVRSWVVDQVPPPAPSFTSTPPNPSGPGVSFSFTDGEAGVTFRCSLDGGTATACSSPVSWSGLANGPHSLAVSAVDAAGNTSGSTSFSWSVDSVPPPAPSFTSTPASPSGASVSFSFTDTEAGATFECSLDGAAFSACSSPKALSGLTDGPHSFSVRAKDALGNVSSAVTHSWQVDAAPPPAPTFTSTPANPSGASVSFSFTDTEAGVTFRCALDSATPATCVSPVALTGLAGGGHTFSVTAVDGAGHVSAPATFSWQVTVDTTPPVVTMKTPTPDTLLVARSVSATWSASDDGTIVRYDILQRAGVGGGQAAIASVTGRSWSKSGLGSGTWCYQVVGVDAGGNLGPGAERCVGVPLDDRAMGFAGPVAQSSMTGAFDGTVTTLTGVGAQATFSFTGRKVGVLLGRGPTSGRANVLVDGVLAKTVDLYLATTRAGELVWTWTSPTIGPHVVTVVWTGRKNISSGGTAVGVDGVVAITSAPPGSMQLR